MTERTIVGIWLILILLAMPAGFWFLSEVAIAGGPHRFIEQTASELADAIRPKGGC